MKVPIWKVQLYEVNAPGSAKAATLVEQFSVTARVIDVAKTLVRAEVQRRGRVLRSINALATDANTLVAYALPKGQGLPQNPARPKVSIPTTAVPAPRPTKGGAR